MELGNSSQIQSFVALNDVKLETIQDIKNDNDLKSSERETLNVSSNNDVKNSLTDNKNKSIGLENLANKLEMNNSDSRSYLNNDLALLNDIVKEVSGIEAKVSENNIEDLKTKVKNSKLPEEYKEQLKNVNTKEDLSIGLLDIKESVKKVGNEEIKIEKEKIETMKNETLSKSSSSQNIDFNKDSMLPIISNITSAYQSISSVDRNHINNLLK